MSTETNVVEFKNELPTKVPQYLKEIEELKSKYGTLTLTDLNDKKQLALIATGRKEFKAARVGVEKFMKGVRDGANAFSKSVIAKEKEIVALIEPEEARLQAEEDKYNAEVERLAEIKRKEEEEVFNGRVTQLGQLGFQMQYNTGYELHGCAITFTEIRLMAEKYWSNLLNGDIQKARDKQLAIEEESKRIEEERIAEEQRLKEENDRLKREEAERLEKQRAEQEMKERQQFARQAEIERKEAEIKEKEEAIAREEQSRWQKKLDTRIEALNNLGLLWNQQYESFVKDDMNVGMVDAKCMKDEEFTAVVEKLKGEIKNREAAAEIQRKKEIEEAEKAAAERERQRIAKDAELAEEKRKADEAIAAAKAARQPDKKKLLAAAEAFKKGNFIPAIQLKTSGATQVYKEFTEKIEEAIQYLITEAEKL